MVKLNKIYTKIGDKGTTGLGSGARVPKYNLRIVAYGTVDETNAALGLARLHTKGELDAALERIQNDLFDLGADLCVPNDKKGDEALRIVGAQVERLESEIDAMNENLKLLTSFVLPGGTLAAAHLHMARTICRRAERLMVEVAEQKDEDVNEAALRYINRLSDYLFVAARVANDNGARDVLWIPGANR
jgi:cob(I)alamin adenosyltransferase